jgi:hypothetical protein
LPQSCPRGSRAPSLAAQRDSTSNRALLVPPPCCAAELPEGEPGPIKIPMIVVLPDNKLRFGWEVPSQEPGCDLERYASSSIKSSLGDEEGGEEGGLADLERGEGGGSGGGDSPPPRRCECLLGGAVAVALAVGNLGSLAWLGPPRSPF